MSLTYVIPDIHGRYDLLRDALASIVARSPSEAGVIVTIGDYVDKGPDSKAVIDRLLTGVAPAWTLVTLKGNHDAMMVEALRELRQEHEAQTDALRKEEQAQIQDLRSRNERLEKRLQALEESLRNPAPNRE